MRNVLIIDKARWDKVSYVPHSLLSVLDLAVIVDYQAGTVEVLKDRLHGFSDGARTQDIQNLKAALALISAA